MALIKKTVGSGGRDYSMFQSAEDSIPASMGSDSYWLAPWNDSEFSVAGNALTLAGCSTGPSNTILVKPDTGQAFYDNANVQTNALRYNQANGVGIRSTNYGGITVTVSEDYVTLDGLQISHSFNPSAVLYEPNNSTSHNVFKNLIIEQRDTSGSAAMNFRCATLINNLVIYNGPVGQMAIYIPYPSGANITNMTVVRPSNRSASTTYAIWTNGTSIPIKNTAVFGFNSMVNDSTKFTGSNNCSDNTIGFGTSNQQSKTYASQFQNTSSSTADFRLKTGADCIDNGTTDTASSPDIAGTTRPQGSAYDIGCWELVASSTAKSVSDTGSGANTVVVRAKLTLTDTTSGADAPALKARLGLSETASGADLATFKTRLGLSDALSGADSASLLTKLNRSDAGAGVEVLAAAIRFALSDAAHAADVVSFLARFAISQTGAGTDNTSALVKVLNSDVGLASDLLTILRRVFSSDTGTATEAPKLLAIVSINQVGSGTDNLYTNASLQQKLVSDTGVGADALLLLFHIAISDVALGQEVINLLTKRVIADTTFGTDIASVVAKVTRSDAGAGAETIKLLRKIVAVDSGAAVEVLTLLAALFIRETGSAQEAIRIFAHLSVSDLASSSDFIRALEAVAKRYIPRSFSSSRDLYTPESLYKTN
jgi:hypothetical protein